MRIEVLTVCMLDALPGDLWLDDDATVEIVEVKPSGHVDGSAELMITWSGKIVKGKHAGPKVRRWTFPETTELEIERIVHDAAG